MPNSIIRTRNKFYFFSYFLFAFITFPIVAASSLETAQPLILENEFKQSLEKLPERYTSYTYLHVLAQTKAHFPDYGNIAVTSLQIGKFLATKRFPTELIEKIIKLSLNYFFVPNQYNRLPTVQSRWYDNNRFENFIIKDCRIRSGRSSIKEDWLVIEPRENSLHDSIIAELKKFIPETNEELLSIVLNKDKQSFLTIRIHEETYQTYKKSKDPTWPSCRKHILYDERKAARSKLYLSNEQSKFPRSETEESLENTISVDGIILKGLTIKCEKKLAFIELIDETLFLCSDYVGLAHWNDAPEPSNHRIEIWDLLTMQKIGIIKLPMPAQYQYGRYLYRLFKVDENNIYLKDCTSKDFVQLTWHTSEKNDLSFMRTQGDLFKRWDIPIKTDVLNESSDGNAHSNNDPESKDQKFKRFIRSYVKRAFLLIISIAVLFTSWNFLKNRFFNGGNVH